MTAPCASAPASAPAPAATALFLFAPPVLSSTRVRIAEHL
jgi:hypothetical protein